MLPAAGEKKSQVIVGKERKAWPVLREGQRKKTQGEVAWQKKGKDTLSDRRPRDNTSGKRGKDARRSSKKRPSYINRARGGTCGQEGRKRGVLIVRKKKKGMDRTKHRNKEKKCLHHGGKRVTTTKERKKKRGAKV